jgi:hypothetical protein
MEAEGGPSPGGVDATKHIATYARVLEGLIKLQFDLGHLARVTPVRWSSRDSIPSGRSWTDFSPAERYRMGYAWLTSDMTPPLLESASQAAADPVGDDA